MKTAVAQDLALQAPTILAWLQAGETIVLTQDGETLGRIIPEKVAAPTPGADHRELFALRFAPLPAVPDRDLSDIVNENRGEA
jgi:antitoxin (DNA-binding transcriptional repressor) of toxin-antitoxin stability system